MAQAMDFPPFGVPPSGGIPTEVGTPNAEKPRARLSGSDARAGRLSRRAADPAGAAQGQEEHRDGVLDQQPDLRAVDRGRLAATQTRVLGDREWAASSSGRVVGRGSQSGAQRECGVGVGDDSASGGECGAELAGDGAHAADAVECARFKQRLAYRDGVCERLRALVFARSPRFLTLAIMKKCVLQTDRPRRNGLALTFKCDILVAAP